MANGMGLTESACSLKTGARITSGGGFSNYYARPAYQESNVLAYLNSTDVPYYYFNTSGRGYPDISAAAHNYIIVLNGVPTIVDGTSASAPV